MIMNILIIIIVCTVFLSCDNQQESSPEPAELFSDAGEAYRTGDLVTCRDLLIRVAVLDPENPNVWRNLGTVNLDLGLYNEAISAYQNVIAIDSTRVDILTDITGALLGAGRIEEALHTGELAVQFMPEDGMAFNNYGMALMEKGYYEDASICFNTALRREPENAVILFNCGRFLLMTGDPESALLLFNDAIANDPDYLLPRIENARTLGILNRHVEAEEQILSVLAVIPHDQEALNILALTYSAQGRQEEAVSILESILLDNPGDLLTRLGLAECLYRYGDLPEALENYRIFMQELPDTTGTSHVRIRIQELEVICE